jgi:hypothetical protein
MKKKVNGIPLHTKRAVYKKPGDASAKLELSATEIVWSYGRKREETKKI